MAVSSDAPLKPSTIILFWLPLAATWLMMSVEGPYIAAIVARMPEAVHSLAAFGVATSLAWLIESPIMMLLSASVALVRDRASYVALRRFAFLLNALVTLGMIVLSLPPVFRFVGEGIIGLPPEISRIAHAATWIMILWPAAIGYRRFYQGLLVHHRMTRRVAYGTVVRLGTMSVVAALLAFTTSMTGALLGATALLAGVVFEAAASRWMARHVVRELMANGENTPGSLLTIPEIARFYYPLALTSMLSMALGPLVTFGLGRGRAPIESLAVWPVVQSLTFVFRSGGVAFQEVSLALSGPRFEHAPEVNRTAGTIGIFSSLLFAVVALTPVETVWLEQVSGLSTHLAGFATWPIRIMIALPALEYLLSLQRARWILEKRTAVVTVGTAVEAAGLAAALMFCVGTLNLVGAIGGAIAVMAGRIAANGFFAVYGRSRAHAKLA